MTYKINFKINADNKCFYGMQVLTFRVKSRDTILDFFFFNKKHFLPHLNTTPVSTAMLMIYPEGGGGNGICSHPGTGAPEIYFPGQSADGRSTD